MSNFGLSLLELNVTNFATFDNQKIKFDQRFNAIIGETGSGKSLILEALQLILGQRADKRIVRKGRDFAVVEASFQCECPKIKKYLDELGYPFESGEVVIKRLIYKSGKTKSFLNLQACSLSTIVNFTSNFVDLVGQFENQKLLSSKYQLQLLDEYANTAPILKKYQANFEKLIHSQDELKTITEKSTQIAQRTDYLNYQIEEIEKLTPTEQDEKELILKKREFQNLEDTKQRLNLITMLFDGGNSGVGVLSLIKKLELELSQDILSQKEMANFQTAQTILEELNYSIHSKQLSEIDESLFTAIIDRLDQYQVLKRKFKVDTIGLESLLKDFKRESQEAQNLDASITQLKIEIEKLENISFQLASELHEKRLIASKKLAKELTISIQNLKMHGAQIQFDLEKSERLSSTGFTNIFFRAETNPGEGFFLIKDIASGGELSRILLSIRNVLSSKDSISIFLFDEIDSGIGGETALHIGRTLSKISESSQVIAITHLPQIANNATRLVIVSKELIQDDSNQRTISQVKEIEGLAIKDEVQLMTPLS